ncbi:MAG: methyltransferase domain-containing protein [Acidobacteriota bacterium]|nr:MAG: methyltransferase domain-containing protein [Acidobacteriota bacterium]
MGSAYTVNFKRRSSEPELIDGSDYSFEEYIDTLADLRRINRLLGGRSAMIRRLLPMILEIGKSEVSLLDVGTGSADIPLEIVNRARRHGIRVQFVVLDLNEVAALEARRLTAPCPEISVVRADALNLPFAAESFDFVLASLFLHHFENPSAVRLIKSFARVAGRAFIINDLRRHPIAYYSIRLLATVFTQNRLVRHDAAVSVLRGFIEPDITDISNRAGITLEIHRHFPYRYILIGRKPGITQ